MSHAHQRTHTRTLALTAKTLIIDEVSMLSMDLFDKVEYCARIARGLDRPFGGLQVIMCGDFLQLPPVMASKFCFESPRFTLCIEGKEGDLSSGNIIVLKRIHRQSNDVSLCNILDEIRMGRCNKREMDALKPCMISEVGVQQLLTEEGRNIRSVVKELRSRKRKREDAFRLASSSSRTSSSTTTSSSSSSSSSSPISTPLYLFATNKAADEVNNRMLHEISGNGKLFRANDTGRSPSVLKKCAVPAELKLKIGARVILLRNLDVSRGLVNGALGTVVDFDETRLYFPVVKFHRSGITLLLDAEEWRIEIGGVCIASRLQIPLRLGWAMTIHRSQGRSLDDVVVSGKGITQKGQAYVALSRATSLRGLRLVNFAQSCVRAHPTALKYAHLFDGSTSSGATASTPGGGGQGSIECIDLT
eukprot:TRINITY_DN939_c0_g1_i2.p1 TRINITY_DN939_c0_g1~~TRINITY_DN939_c0_g1_i2.p1  ORF type:complete len:418 (+),score=107.91 TRINITY_DN939_c0_g1_i2:899-2152(+)